MAGSTSSISSSNAFANGKIDIQLQKSLTLRDLLGHRQGAKEFLEEIIKNGWQYYFIEGFGTAVQELNIERLPYKLQTKEHPQGGLNFTFLIEFERIMPKPKLKGIENLQKFIVNICGKYYPRSVTIDMARNEITFIHGSLWEYQEGQLKQEAREILNILRWLIEKKGYRLSFKKDEKRYQELVGLLGKK